MTELNKQLKDYLSRNEGGDSEKLLPTTLKDIKLPKLETWFQTQPKQENGDISPTNSTTSNSSWFANAQKDPLLPSLSRKQRIFGFVFCIVMGVFCFTLASLYFPFLLLKARKFSLLFTLGSVFSLLSFSFLWGPVSHLRHLFSSERLAFTSVYLTSLVATLYFALSLQSTSLTSLAAFVQLLALVFFLLSNVPGGKTGIKLFTGIFSSLIRKTAKTILPI